MDTMTADAACTIESRFFSAQDGLRLHMRDYAPGGTTTRLPVVCLPGLARTAMDFDWLAKALSGRGHRVAALDYRGRGLSDRDPNPKNYDLAVESADIASVLVAAGIGEAVFVGTSRGGLHILALAASRPLLLRGAVLNDIGPVIEATGLARIRAYVGKLPRPHSWADAIATAKRMGGKEFSGFSDADWDIYVRLTYEEKDGVLVTRYDSALSKALDGIDIERPLPSLWPQFDALSHLPLLVIRGENSDLLSQATLTDMARRHPGCATLVVAGQGHAPLLIEPTLIERISHFIGDVSS